MQELARISINASLYYCESLNEALTHTHIQARARNYDN